MNTDATLSERAIGMYDTLDDYLEPLRQLAKDLRADQSALVQQHADRVDSALTLIMAARGELYTVAKTLPSDPDD
jgi:hypothetical protein